MTLVVVLTLPVRWAAGSQMSITLGAEQRALPFLSPVTGIAVKVLTRIQLNFPSS